MSSLMTRRLDAVAVVAALPCVSALVQPMFVGRELLCCKFLIKPTPSFIFFRTIDPVLAG